ncbi:XrtA/PEP-CTERM system exopolysaccharide export protein [Marinobacter zhanjiangensis]|uniref:Sugar ABC transporter substrate-binding protein n=1 Tax=Marinobacter zhanjiangensis TaxID=578215 RepID=A0ABQ3B5B9_9GAMM|nr:XrtA/PEP-CTERM system exopolysaccharide export protein [Marinobacter zhanjiangensis]GGY80050.1 sugar ABC transporter substrate-binding protein [Marinobacter zhanjiangensis]
MDTTRIKTLQIAILVMLVSFLTACAGIPEGGNNPPMTTAEPEPYRIGVGDTISVHVWRNPELSQTGVVRPDGMISMPLMGDVEAEGMKPEDLADEINEGLSEVIRSPEVTVMVNSPVSAEYRNRVRITGQVGSPLSVPYRQGMTILDLVLEAGGLSQFAAGDRAVLHRNTGEEYETFDLNLDAILENGDMRTNYTVQPGDVVSVPRKTLLRGEL